MAFTYLKVKSAKCLCLLPVVLVLVLSLWSCSWSCKQRSWSCYFGLGLGIKNLVLFASLPKDHQESTKDDIITKLWLNEDNVADKKLCW